MAHAIKTLGVRAAAPAAILALALVHLGCNSSPPDPAPLDVDLTEPVGTAASALGTCVTIQRTAGSGGPVADSTIEQVQGGINFGGNTVMQTGGSGTANWQTLLRFDLSSLPPGIQVTSADLMIAGAGIVSGTINVHRITSSWIEHTVTWNNFAGGFASTIEVSEPAFGKLDFPITALAQSWVTSPSTNFGVLLEETSSAPSRWNTSEVSNLKTHPFLQVCYITPNICNNVVCTALDACHDVGACDPTNGICTNPPKPNGTSCSDGNACTTGDACFAGQCKSGSPVTCPAPDQCHAAGTCDPSSGTCEIPPLADGTACSDGDACTQSDTCQAGTCTGSNLVTCTASDQCHAAGTCDPSTGACSDPAAANGTSCDDGDACTQADACQNGSCVGSTPVVCSASDQCHVAGACDPSTGQCSNPAVANGTMCSDGDACTQSDTCQNGACVGSNPVLCSASDPCHVAGLCDPASGACSHPAAADGTACSDGDACTVGDTCQGGACVAGTAVTCDAGAGLCRTAGACDPSTGVCSYALSPDGTPCTGGFCGTGACLQSVCATPGGSAHVVPGTGSSIQEAVATAADGDTILVQPGNYGELVNLNGKSLDVESTAGPGASVVDGGGAGSVFTLDSSACALVRGFTIRDGFSDYGGGVTAANAGAVYVDGNRIVNNTGPDYIEGGGVYVSSSQHASVTNNLISRNAAPSGFYGGGVYVEYTDVNEVRGNVISENRSRDYAYGGGVYLWSAGSADVSGNTVCQNTAFSYVYGGGIYVDTNGAANITFNTVQRNNAGSYMYGGGIELNDAASSLIYGNQILDHRSDDYGYGGGIEVWSGNNVIARNVVARNVATNYLYGGGIIVWGSNTTIEDNTIDGNDVDPGIDPSQSYIYGGGIELFAQNVQLTNNLVTNNGRGAVSYVYGGGIDVEYGDAAATLSYDDVWNNGNGWLDYVNGPDINGGTFGPGLLMTDPSYAGGGDLHLSSGSPAIDAGDPSTPVPLGGGSVVDLGALEYGSACDDGGFSASGICEAMCHATGTCSDGIQNQGETGVDCGGPCPACPTCFDGIQNQGETQVDCGGPCQPCPTCFDGIQNQGEAAVDCGGPCAPCTCAQAPQVAALVACQAQFQHCEDEGSAFGFSYYGISVIGWNDGSCPGCNCDPIGQWARFCYSDAYSDALCTSCSFGEIQSAHDPCSCDPGTTQSLGDFCL